MQLLIPAAVMFIATTVQAQDDLSGTQFVVLCFLLPVAVGCEYFSDRTEGINFRPDQIA